MLAACSVWPVPSCHPRVEWGASLATRHAGLIVPPAWFALHLSLYEVILHRSNADVRLPPGRWDHCMRCIGRADVTIAQATHRPPAAAQSTQSGERSIRGLHGLGWEASRQTLPQLSLPQLPPRPSTSQAPGGHLSRERGTLAWTPGGRAPGGCSTCHQWPKLPRHRRATNLS